MGRYSWNNFAPGQRAAIAAAAQSAATDAVNAALATSIPQAVADQIANSVPSSPAGAMTFLGAYDHQACTPGQVVTSGGHSYLCQQNQPSRQIVLVGQVQAEILAQEQIRLPAGAQQGDLVVWLAAGQGAAFAPPGGWGQDNCVAAGDLYVGDCVAFLTSGQVTAGQVAPTGPNAPRTAGTLFVLRSGVPFAVAGGTFGGAVNAGSGGSGGQEVTSLAIGLGDLGGGLTEGADATRANLVQHDYSFCTLITYTKVGPSYPGTSFSNHVGVGRVDVMPSDPFPTANFAQIT